FLEYFPAGAEPTAPCTAHQLHGDQVEVHLPARYAAWMASQDLPSGGPPADPSAPVRLDILSPVDGSRVEADPEVPSDWSTLRLRVAVDPPVDQVVWYVDGAPYEVAAPPYEVRWPLVHGQHTFEARLPYRPERSAAVTVSTE